MVAPGALHDMLSVGLPVFGLDGAHLTGLLAGILFIFSMLTTNNAYEILAYAVFPVESAENWLRFLTFVSIFDKLSSHCALFCSSDYNVFSNSVWMHTLYLRV